MISALLLVAALLLWQWVLGRLGRALGAPVRRRERLAGCALVILLCAPWIVRGRLLLPLEATIARNVPGAPGDPRADRHAAYNDVVLQLVPWEAEVRAALRRGQLPWWSDTLGGGSSPWGNPQAAVLAPTAMVARAGPLADSWLLHFALKALTGGLGAIALARRLGIGRACRWLAGVGYGMGGGVVSWGLFPLGTVVAWTPWLVAASVATVRRPRRGTTIAAALVAAAVLLSGHPEAALGAALVAGATALALLPGHAGLRRRAGRVAALGGVALLGAMLAAPALLPQAHAVAGSLRAARAEERSVAATESVERGVEGVESAAGWLPRRQARLALAPWSPEAFGRAFRSGGAPPLPWPVVGSCYVGVLPMLGLGASLLARRRRRTMAPLLGVAALLFLLAAGFSPLRALLARVPWGSAVVWNRWLPAAALLLLVVGCAGLDAVRRRELRRPVALLLLIAGGAASLALAAPARLPLVLASGALALLARRAWTGPLLLAAALLDLAPWASDYLPVGRREHFYPPTPVMRELQGRVASDPGARASATGFLAYPAILPMYGIAEVRTNDPVAPAAYSRALEVALGFRPEGRRYKGALRNPDSPLLSFLGVRWLLSTGGAPRPRGWATREGVAGSPWRLHENPEPLPRWFLPTRIVRVPHAARYAALARLRDPRHVVLSAEDDERGDARAVPDWRPGAVRWQGSRGRVSLEFPSAGRKLLVGSLPYSPGWSARAGRSVLRTIPVDAAFLGVLAGPGIGGAELRYEPPGIRLGTLLCLAAAIGLPAMRTRRKRSS